MLAIQSVLLLIVIILMMLVYLAVSLLLLILLHPLSLFYYCILWLSFSHCNIAFFSYCHYTISIYLLSYSSSGEEEDGGGLSAGAIAGIVIGSLVACVCCSICTCIGCFFLCDHCNYHDFYGLKDCCDSSSDTSRSFRPTSFRRQRSIEPEIQLQRVGSPDSDAEKEEVRDLYYFFKNIF